MQYGKIFALLQVSDIASCFFHLIIVSPYFGFVSCKIKCLLCRIDRTPTIMILEYIMIWNFCKFISLQCKGSRYIHLRKVNKSLHMKKYMSIIYKETVFNPTLTNPFTIRIKQTITLSIRMITPSVMTLPSINQIYIGQVSASSIIYSHPFEYLLQRASNFRFTSKSH